MSNKKPPGLYTMLGEKHPKFISALEELGKVVKQEGPLDEKTVHLVQLAGAAAIGSEGAVHSHARRAVKAGVEQEQMHHAIILLTSTIGFPRVAAALSWVQDIISAK
ncbi:MAG: carboxymuconolactone decarboxylase family protein [Deltaproteobacteria bacterium]|nr:carboxymuconolactone decarboxylase family protein [Deltaproteobacteria bacterium]